MYKSNQTEVFKDQKASVILCHQDCVKVTPLMVLGTEQLTSERPAQVSSLLDACHSFPLLFILLIYK